MQSSHDARMAALYARVIHRVCERFGDHVHINDDGEEEEDASRDRRRAAAADIEERWRERLARYTGHACASIVAAPSEESEERTVPMNEDKPSQKETISTEELPDDATSSTAMGRPHALNQLRVPSSIFATILSGKRKMDQLDGTTEDASHSDNDNDKDEESLTTVAGPLVNPTVAPVASHPEPPHLSVTPLISSAIAPALSLNVAVFPLQCAARDVNVAYRKTIVRGRIKNAMVTLVRRVRADDKIVPTHVLWLTRPIETDAAFNQQGTLVRVVNVMDGGTELMVQVAGSDQLHRVDRHETRRIYECVVATGYVHLHFVPM